MQTKANSPFFEQPLFKWFLSQSKSMNEAPSFDNTDDGNQPNKIGSNSTIDSLDELPQEQDPEVLKAKAIAKSKGDSVSKLDALSETLNGVQADKDQENISKILDSISEVVEEETSKANQKLNENSEDLETLDTIANMINNDSTFLQKITANYESVEELIEDLTKEYPKEFSKMNYDKETPHFLLENEELKGQSQIYNFVNDSIDKIIENSKLYWNNLRPSLLIDCNSIDTSIDLMFKDIQSQGSSWVSNIQAEVKKASTKEQKLLGIVRNYTSADYIPINANLTSRLPNVLSSVSHYLNLFFLNYEKKFVGEVYNGTKQLYRNIRVPKNLISLYKENSIIFFTNLVSASKKDIFNSPSDQNFWRVQFLITPLPPNKQIQSKIYSTLGVWSISYFPNEEEYLCLPYILYRIAKIEFIKSENYYRIVLEELESRDLINKIRVPKDVLKLKKADVPKLQIISMINEKKTEKKNILAKKEEEITTIHKKFGQIIEKVPINNEKLADKVKEIKKNAIDAQISKPKTVSNAPLQASPIKHVLWVDDLIFAKNYENTYIMENVFKQHPNIHFICKDTTQSALDFLKSEVGKSIISQPFRIITDMNRLNEEDPYCAGARLIKACHQIKPDIPILIFTGNVGYAKMGLKKLLVDEKNVTIATFSGAVYNFINE